MNIRFKVMMLLALLFAILSGVVVLIQQRVVMPSFERLEETNAQTAMKRVRYAVDRSTEALQVTSMDWSNWGEAYRFVQDHNPDFVRTNITHASLNALQVSTLVVVDLDGQVVLCTDNVLHTGLSLEMILLDGARLRQEFPWRKFLGTSATPRGLIRTNLGTLMISGAPILDGTGTGQPLGMVIMGRLLTPAVLHNVASQTQSSVAMVQDAPIAGAERIEQTPALTQVYGSFEDVYGRPVMTLRVDVPREITASGYASIRVASAFLIAAAITVLIVLLVLLNRLVLAPLTHMTRHAVAIGDGAELTGRLNFRSSDEFGRLAREFDRMLGRLADARRQLIDQSFQAGFAELAKGVLHNLGNALTPLGVRLEAMERRNRAIPMAELEMAAAELAEGPDDADRGAALAEFMKLGWHEVAVTLREDAADIAVMQRQTALMRASLTEQMSSSANATPVLESVQLPELIAQCLEIVPDASRQRLRVDADESLQKIGAVRVPRTVLRQVLQNLVINAADAVRDSGKEQGILKVAAEIVRNDGHDQLHLHCKDDGIGIPSDDLKRVFAKGFSTKSRSTNHGIGLHWCANAIGALGGRIWAASDGPGCGASFHVVLPLA